MKAQREIISDEWYSHQMGLQVDMLEGMGVNHVALNLRFNSSGTNKTIEILAKEALPEFNSN